MRTGTIVHQRKSASNCKELQAIVILVVCLLVLCFDCFCVQLSHTHAPLLHQSSCRVGESNPFFLSFVRKHRKQGCFSYDASSLGICSKFGQPNCQSPSDKRSIKTGLSLVFRCTVWLAVVRRQNIKEAGRWFSLPHRQSLAVLGCNSVQACPSQGIT